MDVLQELQQCKFKLESIDRSIVNINNNLEQLENTYEDLQRQNNGIIETRQYYKKAIDIIYERSIGELKSVIDSALSYIFYDKNLEIDIELSDKRGKSMTFVIKSNGRRVNLRRGMGMGVKCVISCILHMYYLQCKNSRYLFLDEAYSNISKEYISNFFDFLNKMCDKLGFIVVWITHDERFIPYANKVYRVDNGSVSLVKDEEKINTN